MFSKELNLLKLKNRLWLLENKDAVVNAKLIAKLKRQIRNMESA